MSSKRTYTNIKSGKGKTLNNKGFSLVEVLLAMILLALVVIPLLNNFVSSAKYSQRSRLKQNANTIGQEVMEELKSMSVESIYKLYSSPSEVNKTLLNAGLNIPANRLDKSTAFVNADTNYYGEYDILRDGSKFNTVITIDSTAYNNENVPTGNVFVGYNKFQMPNIEKIHSEDNAVMIEDDRYKSIALSHFYNTHQSACLSYIPPVGGTAKTPMDILDMEKYLSRNIVVTMSDPDIADNKVSVKVEYQYYVDGTNVYGCSDLDVMTYTLYENTMIMQPLGSVYLFYNPLNPLVGATSYDELTIVNNLSLSSADPDISIYMLAQGPPPPSSYKINTRGTIPSKVVLHINKNDMGNNIRIDELGILYSSPDLISKGQVKRIYTVKVSVYKGNTTELLTEFTSTKGD